jgi:hypothetical protein
MVKTIVLGLLFSMTHESEIDRLNSALDVLVEEKIWAIVADEKTVDSFEVYSNRKSIENFCISRIYFVKKINSKWRYFDKLDESRVSDKGRLWLSIKKCEDSKLVDFQAEVNNPGFIDKKSLQRIRELIAFAHQSVISNNIKDTEVSLLNTGIQGDRIYVTWINYRTLESYKASMKINGSEKRAEFFKEEIN